MKKRIVSLLMALALCLSLLPTAALAAEGEPAEQLVEQEQLKPVEPAPAEPEEGAPVEDAEEEEKEELPEEPKEQQDEQPVQPEPVMLAMANGIALQAVDVAGHTNHDEGWTAISTADALTAINAAGNYYLTNNIEISTTWQPVTGVVLCLNGYSITMTDRGHVIEVLSGVTFTLTDCKGTGKITHTDGQTGLGVGVAGTFNMYGGKITGNTVENSDTGIGGGVRVVGTFNMYGGSITGNRASIAGGGVYVKSGTFEMSGGTIGGTGTGDANQASSGGGVYVSGGVYVNADSTFTVSGAPKITDNTQKPTTSSNVYLTTGKPGAVIVIGDAHLASGAKIGVKTGETPTVGTPVTIATNANSGDKQYFSSDESKYSMYVEGSELKLAIVPAHEHRWTYTASKATTITATCGDDSCTSGNGGSITINKPSTNLTYSGSEKAARLTESNWQGGNVTITYKQGDKVLTGAPVNAGTYTASITLGGATASVEYTITKATPTVSGSGTASGTYGQKLSEVTVNDLTAKLNNETVAGSWALTDNTSDTLDTVTLNGSTTEYKAVFTPADTDNYNSTTAKVAVTVNPKAGGSLGTVNLTQKFTDTAEKTYTPNWAGLPAGERWSYVSDMTTSNGGITLNKNDFDADGKKLIYSISGGQVNDTVTFTLKAICADNHYEPFTITVVVTLTDKDTPTVKANNINVTYTGADIPASAITGTAIFDNVSVAGTWSWKSTAPKNVADSGNHTVVFTPADSANYSSVETIITVTIAKATPTGEPKHSKITAGGKTLADAGLTVTGSTLSPNAGTLVWVDGAGNALPGTTVVEKNTTYKWRFTPNDANYEALTGSVELYHVSGGYYYYTPAAGGTTDANKSPRTGDAGLLVYGLTALSSYTGTALVLRRKRED